MPFALQKPQSGHLSCHIHFASLNILIKLRFSKFLVENTRAFSFVHQRQSSITSSIMATPILRFNHKSNVVFSVLVLLCVTPLIQKSGAAEFAIRWSIPTDPSAPHFNQWAENTRFQIGDSIVFNYSPGQDSVLSVNQDDYTNCNTDAPTAKYTDGHTVIKFNQSGPFYFVSGNKDNCLKNEKLVVIVLADRTNRNATAPSPAGEASPPSPAADTTPAPESPPPPPNGASPVFSNLLGSIGAFAASSSLLLL